LWVYVTVNSIRHLTYFATIQDSPWGWANKGLSNSLPQDILQKMVFKEVSKRFGETMKVTSASLDLSDLVIELTRKRMLHEVAQQCSKIVMDFLMSDMSPADSWSKILVETYSSLMLKELLLPISRVDQLNVMTRNLRGLLDPIRIKTAWAKVRAVETAILFQKGSGFYSEVRNFDQFSALSELSASIDKSIRTWPY